MKIEKDTAVSLQVEIVEDGKASPVQEMTYLHGAGNLFPKMEAALAALEPGAKASVTLTPADGFGERDPALVRGNYFDEYRGYDLDRDGTGDVPHRPVRLFSLLVARNEPTLILLHSLFVAVLDAAERAIPTLTPSVLADERPSMRRRVA